MLVVPFPETRHVGRAAGLYIWFLRLAQVTSGFISKSVASECLALYVQLGPVNALCGGLISPELKKLSAFSGERFLVYLRLRGGPWLRKVRNHWLSVFHHDDHSIGTCHGLMKHKNHINEWKFPAQLWSREFELLLRAIVSGHLLWPVSKKSFFCFFCFLAHCLVFNSLT